MSGFEVAGVVLGSIPLVISALEHYQKGKGATASFVKAKPLFTRLLSNLEIQQLYYYQDIVSLLHVAGVAELDPNREDTLPQCVRLLRDPGTGPAIQNWLGPQSAKLFLQLIGRYESTLKKTVVHIKHIRRLPEAHKDDLESLLEANPLDEDFSFMKRLSFTIKRGTLDTLCKELIEDRECLGQIIKKRQSLLEVSSHEPTRKTYALMSRLAKVRLAAGSLCSALYNSCCCRCSPSHKALVRLESRILAHQSLNATTFSLVLHMGPTISSRASVRASFNHSKQEEDASSPDIIEGAPPGYRMVRFAVPASSIEPLSLHSRNTTLNLCRTVRDTHGKGVTIRLQLKADILDLDEDLEPRESNDEPIIMTTSHEESLAQILEQGYLSEDAQLDFAQRTILALNIAASVLQLQQTSWLVEPWDCNKIKLLTISNATSATGAQYRVPGPFVEQDFITFDPIIMKNVPVSEPRSVLLELGILLLEIFTHRTLRIWADKTNQQLAMDTTESRLIALTRWLDAPLVPQPPLKYVGAVRQCLTLYFERKWEWGDKEFQGRFWENVVKPLLETCQTWSEEIAT